MSPDLGQYGANDRPLGCRVGRPVRARRRGKKSARGDHQYGHEELVRHTRAHCWWESSRRRRNRLCQLDSLAAIGAEVCAGDREGTLAAPELELLMDDTNIPALKMTEPRNWVCGLASVDVAADAAIKRWEMVLVALGLVFRDCEHDLACNCWAHVLKIDRELSCRDRMLTLNSLRSSSTGEQRDRERSKRDAHDNAQSVMSWSIANASHVSPQGSSAHSATYGWPGI
jgi:hypothetical protein